MTKILLSQLHCYEVALQLGQTVAAQYPSKESQSAGFSLQYSCWFRPDIL